MPVYVYKNLATGETFEVQQRITEPALTEHPESGEPVKRLVQPVGIAFKGSGFYVTDSRAASNGSTKKAARGSDGGSKDGASSGSDASSGASGTENKGSESKEKKTGGSSGSSGSSD